MWYFSWILGTGLALAFGVLNAIWYEIMESQRPRSTREPSVAAPAESMAPSRPDVHKPAQGPAAH
jgi:cyd operon protein YbgT